MIYIKHLRDNGGGKRDNLHYLTKFQDLKKNNGEIVGEFNKRCTKLYNKFPNDINPSQLVAKFTYAWDYELLCYDAEREKICNPRKHAR